MLYIVRTGSKDMSVTYVQYIYSEDKQERYECDICAIHSEDKQERYECDICAIHGEDMSVGNI